MGFSDSELFQQLNEIERHLNENSTSECLLWCFENRAHLKKNASPLEFYLRRQTYIEHTRKRDLNTAITYAKRFFPAWIDLYRKEIEQAMALLAISPGTEVEPYRSLYDPSRWDDLIALFKKEYLDLHALPLKPQLVANIQAGLASLKTPLCGRPNDCNINCPVCVPPYSDLAVGLPFSHHENSSIVCRISSQVMNENNPPMVLPNGRVYSLNALQDLASKHQGQVSCPQTGQKFDISEAKKIFIL
jgi:macrophage erythroblast attacher